ncbi:MAG: hypothetical protein ACRYFU_23345 [Janthinobacterium lividum]
MQRSLLLRAGLILGGLLLGGLASQAGNGTGNQPDWINFAGHMLQYRQDVQGNRLPDFSTAGYAEADAPIPMVPVVAHVQAAGDSSSGDDTPRIQAALDALGAALPNVNGFRGALLLGPGSYHLAGTLQLRASGVVLRGAGTGEGGSLLLAQGLPHTLLQVGVAGRWQSAGTRYALLDRYVPVGATTLEVQAGNDLQVGDRIVVDWTMSPSFLHQIGMDRIPSRADGLPIVQWKPGMEVEFDRRIVRIEHTRFSARLTLNAPLTTPMSRGDGTTVWRYTFPERIQQVGIENLRADGTAFEQAPGFANPKSYASGSVHFVGGGFFDSRLVQFNAVENSWMRNVTAARFSSIVATGRGARALTIEHITGREIRAPETHTAPEAFSIAGQQILVQHCSITGEYNHVWATQALVAGPVVFYDCTATGSHLDAGPHQRWATGVLYDNLHLTGELRVVNRGNMGTGQGWAGTSNVLWNCETEGYAVQDTPVTYNWAFGTTGKLAAQTASDRTGQVQSPGKHLLPTSLYQAQLEERRTGFGTRTSNSL